LDWCENYFAIKVALIYFHFALRLALEKLNEREKKPSHWHSK